MKREITIIITIIICLTFSLLYVASHIKARKPDCETIRVLAAYLVSNGGSPYFKVAYKINNDGVIRSVNYWGGVPVVGSYIEICK